MTEKKDKRQICSFQLETEGREMEEVGRVPELCSLCSEPQQLMGGTQGVTPAFSAASPLIQRGSRQHGSWLEASNKTDLEVSMAKHSVSELTLELHLSFP